MSNVKYHAFSGDCPAPDFGAIPADAVANAFTYDGSIYSGAMFANASWLTKPFEAPGLKKHESDELHMFVGADSDTPEALNAVIEFQIENDILTLTDTCFVFVPAGAAHGNVKVKEMSKPVMHYVCHMNKSFYEWTAAEATAPAGQFANHKVERYAPVDGKLPQAPEGFLKLLLWIDNAKLAGAPYCEAVWFCTTNDTGPENHVHDNLDEFICFVGSDPENPTELGARVQFLIDGEYIEFTKPCLIYCPRNVSHSPILVPGLDRPIIHFSGGNGGDYIKNNNSTFD